MVYATQDSGDFIIDCNCGCGDGFLFCLSEGWQGEPSCVLLELVEHKHWMTRWQKGKDCAQKIWNVMRGKPICITELILTKEHIAQFRNCIQKLETWIEEVDCHGASGTASKAE